MLRIPRTDQLFIDPNLELPARAQTSDLDDLKHKLLGVVIVLLGVTFLSDATEWDGSPNFLTYGLAIAGVVLALTVYITAAHWTHKRWPVTIRLDRPWIGG